MSVEKGKAAVIYRVRSLRNDTLKHPIEFSKFLFQIGFESKSKISNTDQKPSTIRSIMDNIIYIKSTDGISGCYRGLAAKWCGNIAGAIATKRMQLYMDGHSTSYQAVKGSNKFIQKQRPILTDLERKILVAKRKLAINFASIFVSYPFRVVSLRMMAQFVGRESKYSSVLGSLYTIYKEEGLLGLYCGIVPKILGEALIIVTDIFVIPYLCKFFYTSNQQLMCTHATQILGLYIYYPLENVSNCMIINNTG